MSSHRLDVSGARPLTTTLNDPAATIAQTIAKPGDDVRFQIGNAREVRIGLPPGAKIQRRQYTSRSHVLEGGHIKKDANGNAVYEDRVSEALYLVLPGGAALFARVSSVTDAADVDESEGKPTYENTPHTSMWAKRLGHELDYSESGELLEELDLTDYLPRSMTDGA